MKKLFVFALAVFMVAAFAMPASAKVQSKFGGYFENVWSMYKSLNYLDEGANDYSSIRYRNRIYYTAILHENLKVITKFEMDTHWGETPLGDIGADGQILEIKNAYIDFNLWNSRFEIGSQGYKLHRGLVFNDDATGMKISYRALDNIIPAFWWLRAYNGDRLASNNGMDFDYFFGLANIKTGNMQFVPSIGYLTSNDATGLVAAATAGEAMNIYTVGLDFNVKFDMWDMMITGVYEGGELAESIDISAYAFDIKAGVKVANFKIRGEFLYTSGEDRVPDDEYNGFWFPRQGGLGASYSTSELYRKGWDWTRTPAFPTTSLNPIDDLSDNAVENRLEFGLGVDFSPTKSWKIMFDWWNLNLAEEADSGETDIGNEIDLKARWQVMKNMKLDLIGAYLIIGDAIKPATNDKNAMEGSIRVSLSY
jgi:hypothetical protein